MSWPEAPQARPAGSCAAAAPSGPARLARSFARELLRLVLDERCVACTGALDGLFGPLCARCRAELAVDEEGRCARCSVPLARASCEGAGTDAGSLRGGPPAAPSPAEAAFDGPSPSPCCPECESDPCWPPVAVFRTHRGAARRLVHALKYRRRRELAEVLAPLLLEQPRIREALAEADVLVPVPAEPRRRRRRGYDQAAELARALSLASRRRRRRLPVCEALARCAGEAQVSRSAPARRRALRGAFRARRRAASRIAGRRVVLVDDVVTTGSTVEEAGRVLRDLGAGEVTVVAATRAPRPRSEPVATGRSGRRVPAGRSSRQPAPLPAGTGAPGRPS